MDKFIVSARKYRPQTFETVIGQSHITTTLKNAIANNQLAHAFLFCGPRGVGKTTCARILAKTINCENLQNNTEACNECNSCKSFNEGASLNIHELDAASNNSVEGIRALVEQVRFAPQAGKYKIYIVDEVHMLTSNAFNAFLKTLEEPPPYAKFILATTEKHKILATILSRCQIFDFKRITTNDTVEHLQQIIAKEHIHADKASLQIIAQKSEGCMRDALSILDKIVSFSNGKVNYTDTLEHLNILDHDYFFKIYDCLQMQDFAGAMLLYDEINRKGFEGDVLLNGFAEFIRNILVCKDSKSASLLEVVEGLEDKYKKVAAAASLSYLVSTLNILNESEINFRLARNKRLHIELTLIKLNFLKQAIELAYDNTESTVIKKKQISNNAILKVKQIPSLSLKPKYKPEEKEAKFLIEEPVVPKKDINKTTNTETTKQITQEKAPNTNPTNKVRLIDVLRQKAGDKYNLITIQEAENLEINKLKECWLNYASKLQSQGDKHSTVKTLEVAVLEINDELNFTVLISAVTQQKFIEKEKTALLQTIHHAFKNTGINFKIKIEDIIQQQDTPLHLKLNSKQKFEYLANKFPMLKELKEKLNLEIDY